MPRPRPLQTDSLGTHLTLRLFFWPIQWCKGTGQTIRGRKSPGSTRTWQENSGRMPPSHKPDRRSASWQIVYRSPAPGRSRKATYHDRYFERCSSIDQRLMEPTAWFRPEWQWILTNRPNRTPCFEIRPSGCDDDLRKRPSQNCKHRQRTAPQQAKELYLGFWDVRKSLAVERR